MTEKNHIRKPDWLKIKLQHSNEYSFVSDIVKRHGLHTICSSGKCPNMNECWSRGTATFMILGNICTRACKFCATETGKPLVVDHNEPMKLARSIGLMKLKHCVITSVDRDDLSDLGAQAWKNTILAIRNESPQTTIEVLIPDFDGREELLDIILSAKPDIVGHNIETVKRLTPYVRSRAKYEVSLAVIRYLKKQGATTKSGLMLGIGETHAEILETLCNLHENGCELLTIGQYLRPTLKQLPVENYLTPEQFAQYKQKGLEMGFSYIESGPLVRSSYMAENAILSTKKKVSLGNTTA